VSCSRGILEMNEVIVWIVSAQWPLAKEPGCDSTRLPQFLLCAHFEARNALVGRASGVRTRCVEVG